MSVCRKEQLTSPRAGTKRNLPFPAQQLKIILFAQDLHQGWDEAEGTTTYRRQDKPVQDFAIGIIFGKGINNSFAFVFLQKISLVQLINDVGHSHFLD